MGSNKTASGRHRERAGNGGKSMPIPFLHKFLSAATRGGFEQQPEMVNSHAWPLSLVGMDGPQLLRFNIMGIGETAPRKAGIFIYARRLNKDWRALYIGESANLCTRLSFNEIAADALLSGATDIHIMQLDADASTRRNLAERLIATNRPSLNEEERIHLKPISQGRRPPQTKGKTQAA